jgi:hypothetical protein
MNNIYFDLSRLFFIMLLIINPYMMNFLIHLLMNLIGIFSIEFLLIFASNISIISKT